MKFLVQYKESKKVLEYDKDPVVDDDFFSCVRLLFDMPSNSSIILQKFEAEWGEFINVEAGDTLPDKAKLNCLLHNLPQRGEADQFSQGAAAESQQPTPRRPEGAFSASPVELFRTVQSRMSKRLTDALTMEKFDQWQPKHELITLMADALYEKDHYPPKFWREGLALELVKQYPVLKNRLGPCHAGWLLKIDNRLKALRASDPGEMMKKKRRSTGPIPTPKRGIPLPGFESADEELLEQQRCLLVKEWQKRGKDEEKIQLLMVETFPLRRHVISDSDGLHAHHVKEAYPALFTASEIEREFQRMVRKELEETMMKTFPPLAAKLVLLASKKKKQSKQMEAVLAKHRE